MSHRNTADLVKLSVNDDQVDQVGAHLEQAGADLETNAFWPEQFAAYGLTCSARLVRVEPG